MSARTGSACRGLVPDATILATVGRADTGAGLKALPVHQPPLPQRFVKGDGVRDLRVIGATRLSRFARAHPKPNDDLIRSHLYVGLKHLAGLS